MLQWLFARKKVFMGGILFIIGVIYIYDKPLHDFMLKKFITVDDESTYKGKLSSTGGVVSSDAHTWDHSESKYVSSNLKHELNLDLSLRKKQVHTTVTVTVSLSVS